LVIVANTPCSQWISKSLHA